MTPSDTTTRQCPLSCIALVGVLCLGIGLRLANLGNVRGRTPDESTYTRQAIRLLQQGTAGLRGLAAEYQADPQMRLFPPPTRVAYLWLLAATMRLTGRTDERAGAALSCAASIASLLLLALLGMRFFPPVASLTALLFFSLSPAELELARRAWSDALAGLAGLSLVYLAAEITAVSETSERRPQRRIWLALFVTAGGLGMAIKESGPLIFGLCALWLLWVMWRGDSDWRFEVGLAAGCATAAAASLAWMAHSVGGFAMLAGTVRSWMQANAANPYAVEYQTGPGYLLLEAFWVISPLPSLLLPLGVAVVLLTRCNPLRRVMPEGIGKRQVYGGITLVLLGFLALPMTLPHWLNLRYLSALYGPAYLLAGLGLWVCIAAARERVRIRAQPVLAAALIFGVLLAAIANYRRFHTMFVRDELGDLSVKLVLDSAELAVAERRAKRHPTAANLLDLARRYQRAGRFRDALAAAQKVALLEPHSGETRALLAEAYIGLERWDEAIAAAEQALALEPQLPAALHSLDHARRQRALLSAGTPGP